MSGLQNEIQQRVEMLLRALNHKKEAKKNAEKILKNNTQDPLLTSEKPKKRNELLENLLGKKTTSLLSVFDNIADAYIIWDLKGNVYKINDAAVELFGYDLEKETLTLKKLVYEKDRKLAGQSFIKLKKEGRVKNIKLRFLTKSHKIIWVHIDECLIYDKQNNPIAGQSIIRDISKQKLAKIPLKKSEENKVLVEKSLFEEQEKVLEIVKTGNVFIYEINVKGYFTYANPFFIKKIGYSMEELKKVHSLKFIEESHRDRAHAFYQNLFEKKILEDFIEYPVVTKEGEIVWVEQNVKYNFKSEGHLNNVITIGRDITKQKLAEIALKKSEENKAILQKTLIKEQKKFKLIVENANVMMAESNYKGYYTYVNPVACKKYGYSLEELKKMHYLSVVEESYRDKVQSFIKNQIFQKKLKISMEMPTITKKGRVIWVDQNLKFIFNSEGTLESIITIGKDITKQKLAEIALKKSKENKDILQKTLIEEQKKFQLIVENASVLMAEVNYAGYYIYVNPLAENILGYSIEELKKIHFLDLVVKSHKDKVQAFYKNQLAEKIPNSFLEILINNKEGEELWLGQNVTFIFNSEGRVEKIIVIGRDITKQKLTEIALKKSEKNKAILQKTHIEELKKHQLIVENANALIYESNYKGDFTYANPLVVKLLGYSLEELKKMNFLDFVEQSYKDKLIAFYQNKIAQKISILYIEHPIISKNGKTHWIGQNVNFIYNSEGRIENVITVGKDITKQKLAEISLKKSEEKHILIEKAHIEELKKHQMIVESSNAFIYETNYKGDFTYVNPKAVKLSGYSLEELKKMNNLDFVEESYKDKLIAFYKNLYNQKKSEGYIELPAVSKDGKTHWIGQNVNFIFNSEGKVEKIIIVGRDITERKLTEIALKKSEEDKAILVKAHIEELKKHQIIVENANVFITENNYAGYYTYANPVACKKMGYSMEEVKKMNFLEMVEESYKDKVQALFKDQFIQKSLETSMEIPLVTKEGEVLWINQNVRFIYNSEGRVENVISIGGDVTKRKLTEIAFKKSEDKQLNLEKERVEEQKKFKLIVDNASVIISESDYKGDFTYVNPVAVRILGYSLEEMKKMNFLDLVKQGHKDRVAKFYKNQLIQKIQDSYIELPAFTKEGKEMWFGQNVNFIFNSEGKVEKIITVGRDITSEINKNELIIQQKRELDIIVDNTTFGIALIDQNKIMKCNRAFHELLGYSQNEMLQLTIDDISHPEDIKESKSLVTDMDSGKINKFTIEKKFIQKNGTTIWTKTTIDAVRSKSVNKKYQLIFVEDITEEREIDLKGQVINDIAKAILGKVITYDIAWEIVNIIADYLDTNDCVIYIHNSETNNFDQVAAYGDKVKEGVIIGKISLPIGKGIVGDVAKTGKAEIIKDTSKDKRYIVDDNQRLSEIAVPIISKGKVIGVIDSEHQKKNYFNSEHLETLSNIARIVSIQLDNAISFDLRQKAEGKNTLLLHALENSNAELQQYAHVVSHDLKSPLRSINALVSWLKTDNYDNLDDNSINNFDLIESTLENMEQLISDVLDYSSIDSENTTEELLDLNQIVNSIIPDFQSSHKVSIRVLNDLPILKGEKTRFTQLFQNLISNAVKYNDKEKGIVLIEYTNKKTHHMFSVSDNGVGIEKKYFDRIFEMFQSLHSNKDSTGIGLSIVKKIVDLYNGDIWLESEIGIGTTFYFTLKK